MEKVLEIAKRIPRGNVTTYGEIAKSLNSRAFRAVGAALRGNKNPYNLPGCRGCKNQALLVPCHRVVNSDGSLGGYKGKKPGREKSGLLGKEGVEILNGKINLKKYLWKP